MAFSKLCARSWRASFCARLHDHSFEDAVVGSVSCCVAKHVEIVFPLLLPRGGCGELTSFKFRHVVAVCFCDITVVFNVAIFSLCGVLRFLRGWCY